MIIHAIGCGHFLESAVVLELSPGVEVEALCQPIEVVVDRSETRFAYDSRAEIDEARQAAVDHEKIVAPLEIRVRDAAVVHFLDVQQQRVEVLSGVRDRRAAQGSGIDIIKYQVAIAHQAVTTRAAGETDKVSIHVVLAAQHQALQPAVQAATGRDLHDQAPAVVFVEID